MLVWWWWVTTVWLLVWQIPLTKGDAPEPPPAANVADAATAAAATAAATETCVYIDDESGECRLECTDSVDDIEHCLQQASLGKCSVDGEESKALKRRCPKACRTCWSCDNVGGEESCKGTYIHICVMYVCSCCCCDCMGYTYNKKTFHPNGYNIYIL